MAFPSRVLFSPYITFEQDGQIKRGEVLCVFVGSAMAVS